MNTHWSSRLRTIRLVQVVIAMAVAAAIPAFGQASMMPLLPNGPTSDRINLVILSEGYTEAELAQFRTDATNTLAALFSNSPIAGYQEHFNAFAISVASAESGSDHPSRGIYRNTYFGSSYDNAGIARYLTVPQRQPVYNILYQFIPQYDLVVILVNDEEYGGSGGRFMTISKHSATAEIVRHELGHSFANLGDEYTTGESAGYELPNATQDTDRNLTKWSSWIEGGTAVPTPVSPSTDSKVGLFEGAHYNSAGWYRPKSNCKMRSLGADFCEVCKEALVKAVYAQSRPLRSQEPASFLANLVAASSQTFRVKTTTPPGQPMEIRWILNGTPMGETSSNLVLTAAQLNPGTNFLQVNIADRTSLVRSDPDALLQASHTWQVVLEASSQLRIERPTRLQDGRMVFNVVGTAANGMRIETSSNMTTWTPVATYGSLDGTLSITNSPANGSVTIMRAVCLP